MFKTFSSRTWSSALCFLILPLPLLAQGVRFSIAPSAEYIWWDKELPLKDATFYGARVGADFGRLIGVSAWYHRATDIPVALGSTTLRSGGNPLLDRGTDLDSYGADVQFKLGVGRIVPFVSAGGGVMRFKPDVAPRRELLNYRYGGGIQYDATQNVRATVKVEDSRFRMAPEALSPETVDAPSNDPHRLTNNWTASASLGFALGGPGNGKTAGADRWSLASIPIEPFVGRLEFKDAAMRRQVLAGVRAGIDFGNYFGLRGVYWQGRSDDFSDRQPLQGYGAEAQFNLNASLGVAPFLVAGAQRLDFQDGYVDRNGLSRSDETALVLGGGVGIRLTDNFRLNASARDFIRGSSNLDQVSSTDELSHNWLFSAGFGFNIGRSRERASDAEKRDAREEEKADERKQDREMKMKSKDEERDSKGDRKKSMAQDTSRGRVIILPVPENGELYVRYGSGGGLGRVLGQDSVRTQGTTTTPMSSSERDSLVRVLNARIDSLKAGQRVAPMQRSGMPMRPEMTMQQDSAPHRMLEGVSGYVAGFDALVLGAQLDAGPMLGVKSLHLVPEFALGLIGDKSVLLAVGGEYRFPMLRLKGNTSLTPHARLSLGLLAASGDTDSEFGFNVAYGVTFVPTNPLVAIGRPRFFVEHQGLNFFSHNRLAGGMRWQF